MSLPPLRGHAETRRTLARAHARGMLAQSLLLHGPAGIGKERLGLWLAQLLLCQSPGEEPCGSCGSCRRVLRLEHPDVHWFFPLPRPEGASSSQLRDRLEEDRAAELQLRRENPVYLPAPPRPPAHFLAAIQTLQDLAGRRPAAGGHKVFVVGDAEAMVPQESSPEAANAFLKLLEEPPPDTTLVLTSAAPEALLPTVRSRLLPLRVHPLPPAEVEAFLREHASAELADARRVAARSGGAIGRALVALAQGEAASSRDAAALAMLRAVLADGPVERLALAHAEGPTGGRGSFLRILDTFAERLRDLLAAATGAAVPADAGAATQLARRPLPPEGVLGALARVLRARELALGNVNPQLILAVLLRDVQADLRAGAP